MSQNKERSSNLTYLHKVLNESLKSGEKSTYEEVIIDGPKGVTIKMFSKSKDGSEKIIISGNGDKFVMKTMEGDKKDEKSLSKDDLIAELKKNKRLKFAADFAKEFAKNQKGGAWDWLERPKKKGSKRGSRKGSKKRSKRGSKKGSKKH